MLGLVSVSATLPMAAKGSLLELWRFGCEIGAKKGAVLRREC